MKIKNHKLVVGDAKFQESPDHGNGIVPELIVIHYTGAGSARGTIGWLTRLDRIYVSAHLVISRDGDITQLVPFNKTAFHAGKSTWLGRHGANAWSVGVELANWGKLSESDDGQPLTWTGKPLSKDQCVQATHKNGHTLEWWERYSLKQLDACVEVCRAIAQEYSIQEVVGHDDIAPERKTDPGPALDLSYIQSQMVNPNKANLANEDDSKIIHVSLNVAMERLKQSLIPFAVDDE